MGIQGLLPLLKSIMVPIHLRELEGCSVAVDTYSWLHKGALSCGVELCKGLPTTRHIEYCMHRVNLLRHYGVKPVLVFDGGLLPMKIEQENKRARSRKENLTRAIEHESNGNHRAAYECYQKAVDITPSMARELIQVLKKENIYFVVAPYEADAQMTFLAISKQVDAVITEDSDLIPFGCPRVIFKLDKFGQGVEFRYCKLQQNKELNFVGFTKRMILEMCILSGCDYLQSLPGMGLKTSHALIKKFKTFDKVIKHLKYTSISVPPTYEESFQKAILTFEHQRVYDPVGKAIVHLSDVPDAASDDWDFLGPLITQQVAKGIAEGDLDPITKMPFQVGDVRISMIEKTCSLNSFKPKNEKKLELPAQKNVLTKYFCFASLEAKREFKAPRISPNLSSPVDNQSQSSNEQTSPVALISDMTQAEQSLLQDEEDGFNREVPEVSESTGCGVLCEIGRPGPSLLQQAELSIHKPCTLKGHEPRNSTYVTDGKARTENGKVIVRSSYFKRKHEANQENEKENIAVKTDNPINLVESEHLKRMTMKRKSSPADETQEDGTLQKHRHVDGAISDDDYCAAKSDKPSSDANIEKKFGADISHLSCYSDIAEKSLERFVSVISPFRYTGSGSRPSGLRAPLKDVRNMHMNRTANSPDFSQFAYIAKNRKSTIERRRC